MLQSVFTFSPFKSRGTTSTIQCPASGMLSFTPQKAYEHIKCLRNAALANGAIITDISSGPNHRYSGFIAKYPNMEQTSLTTAGHNDEPECCQRTRAEVIAEMNRNGVIG
jgi:hypothetical protein